MEQAANFVVSILRTSRQSRSKRQKRGWKTHASDADAVHNNDEDSARLEAVGEGGHQKHCQVKVSELFCAGLESSGLRHTAAKSGRVWRNRVQLSIGSSVTEALCASEKSVP